MKKFLAALLALSLTFGSVALPAAESGVIAKGWIFQRRRKCRYTKRY